MSEKCQWRCDHCSDLYTTPTRCCNLDGSASIADTAESIPADCDVRKILLRVTPGDGNGHEEYARNVGDVEALLSEMGSKLEEFQLGIADTAGAKPWIELWHGSDPHRGWSIIQGRDLVAYLGGDEGMSDAVSAIVKAHNDCFDCAGNGCTMNCSGASMLAAPPAPSVADAPCEHEWQGMTEPHKECMKCGDVRRDWTSVADAAGASIAQHRDVLFGNYGALLEAEQWARRSGNDSTAEGLKALAYALSVIEKGVRQ